MNILIFFTFIILSALLGFSLHIMFLKKSLVDSLVIVANNYDLRIEQRKKLSELTADYFHSLPADSLDSLNELDKILNETEDAISYSNLALKSNSIGFIKEAKRRIVRYHKINKKDLNVLNKEKETRSLKSLKATWNYKAEEIIDLVSQSIRASSKQHNSLSHQIPRRYKRKKPTTLVLNEIALLSAKL